MADQMDSPIWIDWINALTPILVLFMLGMLFSSMMKGMFKPSKPRYILPPHYSSTSRLGEPKTEAERKETHLAKYGISEVPERGAGLTEHHSNPSSTRVGYALCSHDTFYITSKPITRGELAALAASFNRIDEVYDVIAEHPGISFPGIWESVHGITLGKCETALYELQQRGYIRKETAHHSNPSPKLHITNAGRVHLTKLSSIQSRFISADQNRQIHALKALSERDLTDNELLSRVPGETSIKIQTLRRLQRDEYIAYE